MVLRENFLKKMRKSKKKERASEGICGKRKEHGSMASNARPYRVL